MVARIVSAVVGLFSVLGIGLVLIRVFEPTTLVGTRTETCMVTAVYRFADKDNNVRNSQVEYRCPSVHANHYAYFNGEMSRAMKDKAFKKLTDFLMPLDKFECVVVQRQGRLTGINEDWQVDKCTPPEPNVHGLP